MKRCMLLLAVSAFLYPQLILAASPAAERLTLMSRVQSMSHGYYSEAQWDDVFTELSSLRARAERAQNHEEIVALNTMEAMIHHDMRANPEKALAILDETRETYAGRPVANLRRVYTETARLHARTGNEAAISALIEEFRESPHFDPVQYPFSGGYGREVPLAVTRPQAAGNDSITVSTMERYRNQARFAPGRSMPEIAGEDRTGRHVSLSDYRGKLVLVDFWFPGFTAWERHAPGLVRLHRTYQPQGFEVLGVPLGRDDRRIDAAIRQHGMPWPQVRVDQRTLARMGIFGDARNFLVDRNGVIVGRDLRGGDLDAAVRVMLR